MQQYWDGSNSKPEKLKNDSVNQGFLVDTDNKSH